MKISFRRKRIGLLILGFVIFQGLYVAGLMYLGKSNNMFGSFSNIFTEDDQKRVSVMLIQYANSTKDSKFLLNLRGFIEASDKYPNYKVSVVEGVGNNMLLLSDIVSKAHERGVENIFVFGFPPGLGLENIFNRYPDIHFFYYNGKSSDRNVSNYGVSIFMEKYYLGMLAGMQTVSNQIAYVSDFPFSENIRSLNYFARGVEFVNSDAVVHAVWTENSFDKNLVGGVVQQLHSRDGVDVVSGSMMSCYWCDPAEELGIGYIGQHKNIEDVDAMHYLSSYVLDYKQVYLRLLAKISNGFAMRGLETIWFGEEEGAVSLGLMSANVAREAVSRIDLRRAELLSCDDYVFRGPVYANNGQLIAPEDSLITDNLVSSKFFWLYKNVSENHVNNDGTLMQDKRSVHAKHLELLEDISFYEIDLRQQNNIHLVEMDKKESKLLIKNTD